MRFDLTKIDDHIRKLQEIRRLVSDSEMAKILLESLTDADEMPTAAVPQDETLDRNMEAPADEADLLIKEVMQSTSAETSPSPAALWSRSKR